MFKHYLSYQLALSFHRSCQQLSLDHPELPQSLHHRLMRSAEQMIHQFARAIYSTQPADEAKHFFACLINLRDCLESLEALSVEVSELKLQYNTLQGRLERICETLATDENGQLRMLG